MESCPVEPVRDFRRRNPDHVDRQLHQHLRRSEGRERHPLHLAQRRAGGELDSAGQARPLPARPQSGQLRQAADRPREHEDLAGRLHRACHLPGAAAGRGQGASIPTPRWWPIPNARKPCWPWPISSAPLPPSSTGASASDAARVHRHDRKRRQPLAAKAGAGEALLLRGQRKLQLQRVPVHEAQHAGETARLPARSGAARGTVRGNHAARARCRSSACWP